MYTYLFTFSTKISACESCPCLLREYFEAGNYTNYGCKITGACFSSTGQYNTHEREKGLTLQYKNCPLSEVKQVANVAEI